jgi:hypothetical protein
MMYGGGKSDFAIVAVKPANKAEPSVAERSAAEPTAAEPVEPRAETKGNAGQQSTCRAQNRISVPQALERIRKVAKERKKERFTDQDSRVPAVSVSRCHGQDQVRRERDQFRRVAAKPWGSPAAQRVSICTLRPSVQPKFL